MQETKVLWLDSGRNFIYKTYIYIYLFIGPKKKKKIVKAGYKSPLLNDCGNLRQIAFLALLER